jgi:hypothetical protein
MLYLYQQSTRDLFAPVTPDEIKKAIAEVSPKLIAVERSAYSFFKDYIRLNTCNEKWPDELRQAGITARQRHGEEVFQFVRFDEVGATYAEPFPNPYDPPDDIEGCPFEVRMSPKVLKYGIPSETWLVEIIKQNLLAEMHFAAHPAGLIPGSLRHLCSNKNQPAEIDHTMAAEWAENKDVFITLEGKTRKERILPDQIRNQVLTAFRWTSQRTGDLTIDRVMPWCFKVVEHQGQYGIHIIQFVEVSRSLSGDDRKWKKVDPDLVPLRVQSQAIYMPSTPILGLSKRTRLTIWPRQVNVSRATTIQFTAEGGSYQGYVWSIESNTGATISPSGLYTRGTRDGEDIITVTDAFDSKKATAKAFTSRQQEILDAMMDGAFDSQRSEGDEFSQGVPRPFPECKPVVEREGEDPFSVSVS